MDAGEPGEDERQQMTQRLRQDDVDKIAELDSVRSTMFYRDPDRPTPRFVKPGRRTPPEVRRAQGRMRTARWRSEMDRRRAPTAEQIGMAMVTALATTSRGQVDLTRDDRHLVQAALHHLVANGFDIDEAKRTMRRIRNRLVDPADREGEASESCSAPLLPSSWSADETIEALF